MTTNPGSFGVWTGVLDHQPAAKAQDLAAELEAMGWGAIWFPEVIGRDALVNAALLLTGTEKIVLATGIANIYARDAMAMRAGWNTLSEAFPGRFIMGL